RAAASYRRAATAPATDREQQRAVGEHERATATASAVERRARTAVGAAAKAAFATGVRARDVLTATADEDRQLRAFAELVGSRELAARTAAVGDSFGGLTATACTFDGERALRHTFGHFPALRFFDHRE